MFLRCPGAIFGSQVPALSRRTAMRTVLSFFAVLAVRVLPVAQVRPRLAFRGLSQKVLVQGREGPPDTQRTLVRFQLFQRPGSISIEIEFFVSVCL